MTKEELIEKLRQFQIKTGEIPKYGSYKKYPELIPPGTAFAKKFGTFNCALLKAGFEPFFSNGKKNPKRSKLIIKNCLECGNILKNNKNTFCNSKCNAKNKQIINQQKCTVCDKIFVSKHRKHFICSKECVNESLRIISKKRFIAGELLSHDSCKKHLVEESGYRCSCCNISEWNGKEIVLEMDHIDGDPDNQFPSNLRLLCPNCHSQTQTFRRKNLDGPKSDRRSKARRKRYKNVSPDPQPNQKSSK